MKQDEHQGDLAAFVGEAIAVAPPDTFQQTMRSQFAKILAELGERIGAIGQAECREDGWVDVG